MQIHAMPQKLHDQQRDVNRAIADVYHKALEYQEISPPPSQVESLDPYQLTGELRF
ncbi:hypothetical protein [Neosynechococcus sphagnicola]|uniref:hypothetical protein n=1 Tax=Neosynechococcus sphagnicola TaxID=1501145 RepID=UPI00138E12AE|nr:hypothetical protein [Neosynechococcus sphagnicola]